MLQILTNALRGTPGSDKGGWQLRQHSSPSVIQRTSLNRPDSQKSDEAMQDHPAEAGPSSMEPTAAFSESMCSQSMTRQRADESLHELIMGTQATIPGRQIEAPQSWDEHPLERRGATVSGSRWALNEESDTPFAHSFGWKWRVALSLESCSGNRPPLPEQRDIKKIWRGG